MNQIHFEVKKNESESLSYILSPNSCDRVSRHRALAFLSGSAMPPAPSRAAPDPPAPTRRAAAGVRAPRPSNAAIRIVAVAGGGGHAAGAVVGLCS